MSESSNKKRYLDFNKKPLSPFLLFCSKIRNEYEKKKKDIPNVKLFFEMWKNLPDKEKKPFYIKYEEDKNQYEKEKNKENAFSKVKVEKRTYNELMNNSINSSSNDNSFINNKSFKPTLKSAGHIEQILKQAGPIEQSLIIHHNANIRKSMSYDINSSNSSIQTKINSEKQDIISNDNNNLNDDKKDNISINPFLSSKNNQLSKISSYTNNEIKNPFLKNDGHNNNIF